MALPNVRWKLPCLAALLWLGVAGVAVATVEADVIPGGAYRLPGKVVPENYKLKMVPYLELNNLRFEGWVDILVSAVEDTSDITLHAHADLDVQVTDVVEQESQASNKPVAKPSRVPEHEFLVITVGTPLAKGKQYLISLKFSGKLQKDNRGFYLSTYETATGFEYIATTHFEATSARKAFPCFDEPALRATFDISLAKLDNQIALSNMPPLSDPSDYDPSIGNRRWVQFQQTPSMPTYLVAFIVSKLEKVPTTNKDINIYVRPDAKDAVKKIAEVAPKLLSALENFLGILYPLPKVDLVAIPDFPAGAMENWGLVTFKESRLLIVDGVSRADQEASALRVVAHEFTHLWFGDLVTLKWWNTIWQQEGMAAFMESYILDKATYDDYDAMTQLGTTRALGALEVDALEHSWALTKDVSTPEEISDHFGTITYSKGSNLEYMLLNLLGESVFKDGLHSYLASNKYSATTPDDFAKALQDAADSGKANFPLKGQVNVKEFIESWTLKEGYPVLNVMRNYQDNTITVSQSRFLSHEPADAKAKESKWIIPFFTNSIYDRTSQFAEVIKPGEDSKKVTLSYLMSPGNIYLAANEKQAGFYRVNYDMRNWLLLANSASGLNAATRASLFDDLYALDRAGKVDTWLSLYFLQKVLGDTSYNGERSIAPWITGAKVLRRYAAAARADPELSTYFQTYVAKMVTSAFQAIGWESEYDSSYNRYRKSVVRDTLTQLACDAGMPECRRKALAAFNTATGRPIKDPNTLAAEVCEGAKNFETEDLSKLVNQVVTTEDPTARASYLRGAGCVRDPTLIQTLLDLSAQADSGLSSAEVVALHKSIMDHSADGCDTVLSYVSTNFDSIVKSLGSASTQSVVREIAGRIYSEVQLQKVEALATKDASDAMKDIVALARASQAWVKSNLREFKEWVAAQVGVTPPRAPFLVQDPVVPTAAPSAVTTTASPTVATTASPAQTTVAPPAFLKSLNANSDWMLPTDLVPSAYTLDVDVDLDVDQPTYTGTVGITVQVAKATKKVVLNAHESLTISATRVAEKVTDTDVKITGSPEVDKDKQFLTLNLETELIADKEYVVTISFSGPLSNDLAGLYLSTYTVGSETKRLAVTQFEPTSARKAFPCFDEPGYRATFTVSITRPSKYGALSNTKSVSDTAVTGSTKKKATFETTPPMSTYLVALLVSEFEEVPVQAAGPKISIWVRGDAKGDVALATELAPKVLKKFEELTGIPYKLDKLDLAAIPDFAPGAMENWGLITFKDTVLRTPKNALAHRRFNCARDITHEFAHMWFGDLVTNKWWSSLWQQEGMAAFMEAWVLDQATDYEYDAQARQKVDRIEQGLMDDALETAFALTDNDVSTPAEIEEHSGEITYNKGAGFLRMIKAIIGERTFWKGLRLYLNNRALSTAVPEDLAEAFQAAADDNGVTLPVSIKDLMDSWTLQKGYPVLTVVRHLHDAEYSIEQSRFLSYTPEDASEAEKQTWIVPYHCAQLYSDGGQRFDQFLQNKQQNFNVDLKAKSGLSYLICNPEQEGFYRVNYDLTSWQYIALALNKGMITSAVQRGALLDDALTMLRARQVEPWVVMYMLQQGVSGELSLPVWGALSKGINYLRAVLASDSKALEDFNKFVVDITAESYGQVDWYNFWGWEEPVQTNEVRQILTRLACDAGEQLCSQSAASAYRQRNLFPSKYVIHQENYGAMLCSGLRGASADQISSIKDKFQKGADHDQRVSFAYAMGCIGDHSARLAVLKDLLLRGDQKVYQSNEVSPLIESLITHGGESEVLLFLSENWAVLQDIFGESTLSELLQMAAERVHTEEQYQKVKAVADKSKSKFTAVAEQSAANGLKFALNELDQIKDFLAAYTGRVIPDPTPAQPLQYRLPGNVVPKSYTLRLIPNMKVGDFKYEGSVMINAHVEEDTNALILHSHEHLKVEVMGIKDVKTGKPLGTSGNSFNVLTEMLTINMDETLVAGQDISIHFEFAGKLQKDKLGFYISDYPEAGKWKYIATTQFEQTYARKAFPCFDEPKYRATFDISIVRETDQIALSNTPIKSTSEPKPDLDGRVEVTFETTPTMPTYLVAFIISEMKQISTSNPMINIYVRPEAEPLATFSAEIAPKLLAEIETFTGIKYPLKKLDLVAIPDFYFGAMENWGLITYRENRMLYDEKHATDEYKIFVAEVIAHEMVHLWFGDYVTLDWWSSGWLKEGMAEFLEYVIVNKVMAKSNDLYPLSRLTVDDIYEGMRTDALEHVSPLTDNTVQTPDEISEHMGLYTYDKGAGLNFMLMGVLGEETFKKGLNHYLNTNAYGTGTPESYAAALQLAAEEDMVPLGSVKILDIVNSWSTKPGLPVITLLRDYTNNSVTISQARYMAHSPQDQKALDSKWVVPIAIYYNYGVAPLKFTNYLTEDETSVNFDLGGMDEGGTIYGNWLIQGYYYTNYDLLNWIRIGSALGSGYPLTNPMYRASVIHDAFAVAKANLVDPWIPLFLLDETLIQEANAAPWKAAYNGLRLYASLVRGDEETDMQFQTYLRDFLMEISFEFVTWDGFRGDIDGKVGRDYATKLACYARYSGCRTRALKAYNDYLSDPDTVDPNVLAASLCEGVSHGNVQEFTSLYEDLQFATERSRRMSIVYGLGCVQNTTLVKELLHLGATEQGFEPQEVRPLFQSILDNSKVGVEEAVTYVVDNYEYMVASLGQSSAEGLVLTVAERVYSYAQYVKLMDISNTKKLTDALEVAYSNVQWISNNKDNLKDWLLAANGVVPDRSSGPVAPTPAPTAPAVNPTPGPGPAEPPNPVVDEWRLPTAVVPLHYELMMVPFLEVRHFEFEGRVTIHCKVKEATKNIVLHAKDLLIAEEDNVEVYDSETGAQSEVKDIEYNDDKGFMNITLAKELKANSLFNLSMEFSAKLRTDNFGFYLSSYVVNNEIKYMATTHFEATSARKAFPCFDEPRFRATFDISVARLSHQTALSNMPRIRSSSPDQALGGRIWDDFSTTPPMPTYLVAFMVHELTSVSTSKNNVKIWVRPNAVSDAAIAARVAPKVIEAMEDYTGFKLPIPKVDLVAIPTFPIGAMENWGLVTFREDYLINPKVAKSEHEFTCANVITHELSHLWFGDLVTIDWWSAAWLKEGMASFLEMYMLDRAVPSKYSAFDRIVDQHTEPALVVDSREFADILTNYDVGSPDEISDHMGIITYSKGGSFLRMMMTFVGEDAYQRGLRKYISSNAFYWGTPELFASALSTSSPLSQRVTVRQLVDSWTLKAGYPVVTLVRDRVNGIATVTQERFLSHEPINADDEPRTWHIPYNIWIEGEEEMPKTYTDVILESQTEKVILMDNTDYKLALINADQTGFYRVNYDLLTWVYVYLKGPKAVPSAKQRAVLIDDAFALAMANKLDMWVPLATLESYLPTEKDLLPWLAARNAILRLRSTPDIETSMLDKFVLSMVDTLYTTTDWDSRWPDLEEYDQKLVRDVVTQLACMAGSTLCRRSGRYDFEAWFFKTAAVNPDTLASTICEGLRTAEESITPFAAIWARFLAEQDPTVRSAYLYGFGCLDEYKAEKIRTAALMQEGISAKEAKIFFNSYIVHVKGGAGLLLSAISADYAKIKKSTGVQSLAAILQLIAERTTRQYQYETIASLVKKDPTNEMLVVNQTALTALEWSKSSLDLVNDFLEAYDGEAPPSPQPPAPTTPVPFPTDPTPTGDFRLPDKLEPESYTVKIVPYLSGEKFGSFDGEVSIKVTAKVATWSFYIHALGLDFTTKSITITDESGKAVSIDYITRNELHEWVHVELTNSMDSGKKYTIKITYTGKFSNDQKGFFLSSEDDKAGPLRTAVTALAPTYARRVYPCFDEPAIKATFTLTVAKLPTETVVSNTAVQSTSEPQPDLDHRVLVTFKTTEKMSTHSLTIVVSTGMTSKTSTDNKVTVYGSNRLVDKSKDTLTAAVSILKTMENICGTPSGLDALALVGVKDLHVEGTDNWGIDVLRENALVNLDASPSAGEAVIYWLTTLTHRMSQHWFGNLVSMSWWDNVWLTDGFANYFKYKAASQTDIGVDLLLYPNTFTARVSAPALLVDSMESSPALHNARVIGSTSGIERSINDITGLKGGAIIQTIRHFMGATAFEAGLKKYLTDNHLGGVESSALYAALQASVDKDTMLPADTTVETVLSSWVDRPGYPLVTVMRDYDANTVAVSQERFLMHTPHPSADMAGSWWIPASYSPKSQYVDVYTDAPVRAWVQPGSTLEISLPAKSAPEWFLLNLNRLGFYRVNYDMRNWLLLAKYNSVPGNHVFMETATRIALLDDALTLARTGRLDYITALQYVDYLRTEYITHEIFATARDAFGAHLETFLLEGKLHGVYKSWVQQLLAGAIKYFDYTPKEDDDQRFRVARGTVMEWACDLEMDECIKPAKQDFTQWLTNIDSVPHDTLASTVCAGVKNPDHPTFGLAVSNLNLEMNDVYRKAIIRGLGCVKDHTMAANVLQLTAEDTGLRNGEALEIFKSVSRFGPSFVEATLDFLSEKSIEVIKMSGLGTVESIVSMLAGRISTQAQMTKLNAVLRMVEPTSTAPSTAAALLLANDNLAWHDTNLDSVGDMLYALSGVPNPDLPLPPTTTTTTTTTPEPTMPTGPVPTDPATRTTSKTHPTWFTLPPTEPTSPLTLPPLPTRATTQPPTAAPQPTNKPGPVTTAPPETTTKKAGAGSIAANTLLVVVAAFALQRWGAAA